MTWEYEHSGGGVGPGNLTLTVRRDTVMSDYSVRIWKLDSA